MTLWIKEGTIPDNVIVAELSRGNDEDSQHLREVVQKFQVHTCRPNRCFCTTSGKVITRCKYGFPQKLQNKDGIGKGGIIFEYKRTEQEDRYIVPYNPYVLQMWGAHICIMKITANGLDWYLVKYITKEEPTFGLYVVAQNEVQKYLDMSNRCI